MACSKDHGSKDHAVETIPGLCSRNKRCKHTSSSCRTGNSCKHHTCNFWKHNGSRGSTKNVSSKMGNWEKNCVGMDNYHTCQCSSVICYHAIDKSNSPITRT